MAILGHNGSGKSTLAKHMNAILVPTGGTMWVLSLIHIYSADQNSDIANKNLQLQYDKTDEYFLQSTDTEVKGRTTDKITEMCIRDSAEGI